MPETLETTPAALKETLERISLARTALSVNRGIGGCAPDRCTHGVGAMLADMQPNDDFTRHPHFEQEEAHALRHMINGRNRAFNLDALGVPPQWLSSQMPQFPGEAGGVTDHMAYVGKQIAAHALHRIGLVIVKGPGKLVVPESTYAAVAYERADIRIPYDRAVYDLTATDGNWGPTEFEVDDLEADGYHAVFPPNAYHKWWAALDADMAGFFPVPHDA